ncbi:hypothetical protein FSP39_021961 [Pinctada imbricata]|uniref:G-protein coupled receptors family 1 profile domain-containing protein n=1 Tax=Pinctada imbricata TaxID=66713 RepID=A0AA88YPB0_PINIB|nr:hypothetical protein FSP39_021961 [Pinctada imbricata]
MNNSTTEEDRELFSITTDSTAAKTSLDIINAVYPPLLIVVGTACNVFIIFVMRTKYFRSHSTSVFMIAGAINDFFSLVLSMTTHWLYVTFDGIYYKNNVKSICKFLDFYGWGNCDFGILITTAMTVERALAIKFPLKRLSINSIKQAKITVFILTIIVVAKEFHFLIGSNMVADERQERLCDVFPNTDSYKIFWTKVWPWLHLGFLVICFLVMTVSNIILIHEVWKSSRVEKIRTKFVSQKTKSSNHKAANASGRIERQWRNITPMLIGESLVLLIFTFPFTIQLSISGYNPDFYKSYEMGLLFSITFYMLYTNKCVTFFVYLITGTRFRYELRRLLKNKCCWLKHMIQKDKRTTRSSYISYLSSHANDVTVSPPGRSGKHNHGYIADDILPYSTSNTLIKSEYTHL